MSFDNKSLASRWCCFYCCVSVLFVYLFIGDQDCPLYYFCVERSHYGGVSSFSYSATSNDHVMDCGHLNVQTASGGWPSLVSQSVSHSQQQDMDVDYPNGNISTRNNSSCRTGEAAARNIICEGYRYRSAPRDRILLWAFLPGEATTDWFSAFAARISNNFNNMRQVKNTDYITTDCALIDQNWSGMNFNEPKSTSTEANSLRQLIRMREMEREFRACKQMLTDLMSLSHGGGREGGGKWATSLLLWRPIETWHFSGSTCLTTGPPKSGKIKTLREEIVDVNPLGARLNRIINICSGISHLMRRIYGGRFASTTQMENIFHQVMSVEVTQAKTCSITRRRDWMGLFVIEKNYRLI